MKTLETHIQYWDDLDGITQPAQTTTIYGHSEIFEMFMDKLNAGRMHHAWLLSGPRGIGKASLVFQIAGYLFAHPSDPQSTGKWHPLADDHPVRSQIAGQGHPNFLYLGRSLDSKKGKFRSEITVNDTAQLKHFFGNSRAMEGWRICLIDTADELNRNAANAILKLLEEPPEKTIFFLISNRAGQLLPTLRSRTLHVPVRPLNLSDLKYALNQQHVEIDDDKDAMTQLWQLSGGSVRKALLMHRYGGLELYQTFCKLLQGVGALNWQAVHKLANSLSPRSQEEKFNILFDIAELFIGQIIHQQVDGAHERRNLHTMPLEGATFDLARLSQVWEKTVKSVKTAESFNLDRKQLILDLFDNIANTRIRPSGSPLHSR